MKPLLVGEANPYQTDPVRAQHYALYPDPPRCAGWNLCHKIMQLDEREYLRRFDRVNLCDGKWSMKEARRRANRILFDGVPHSPCKSSECRRLVLCGAKVTKAFLYSFVPFTIAFDHVVILPHPSGLSRAWNEPGAYERAREVLREAGVL